MSLANYADLKAAIIDWSHRDDLDTRIDDFIAIAEAEMLANDIEPLHIRTDESEQSITTSTSTRFVALPTGYQSGRKMRIQISNGESYEIYYRSPAQLELISQVGMPRFFTITSQIEFDRISDIAYTGYLQCIIDFTGLSTANTTNDVLTNHPNIYIFGLKWAISEFADQYQEAAENYAKFMRAIKGANKKRKIGAYGPAPQMRIEGTTP